MISFLNVVVMCCNISLSSQNCDIFLINSLASRSIYLFIFPMKLSLGFFEHLIFNFWFSNLCHNSYVLSTFLTFDLVFSGHWDVTLRCLGLLYFKWMSLFLNVPLVTVFIVPLSFVMLSSFSFSIGTFSFSFWFHQWLIHHSTTGCSVSMRLEVCFRFCCCGSLILFQDSEITLGSFFRFPIVIEICLVSLYLDNYSYGLLRRMGILQVLGWNLL